MNTKILTKYEQHYLNHRYSFSVHDDFIHVKVSTQNKTTPYRKGERIKIVTKVRVITLTTQALELWEKAYLGVYSPIDVQNAINALVVSSQEVTEESIHDMLELINKKNQTIA